MAGGEWTLPGATTSLGGQGKAITLPAPSAQHRESRAPTAFLTDRREQPHFVRPLCTPCCCTEPPKATPRSPREALHPPQHPCPSKPTEMSTVHSSADRPECMGEKQKDFASKLHDPKRQGGWQRSYKPPLSSLAHAAVPTEVTALLRMLQQEGARQHPESTEGETLCSRSIPAGSSSFPGKDRMSSTFNIFFFQGRKKEGDRSGEQGANPSHPAQEQPERSTRTPCPGDSCAPSCRAAPAIK